MYANEQKKIQASEARQRFFELLERVQKTHQSVVIERKGHPVAVLIDYKEHVGKREREKKGGESKALFERIRCFQKRLSESRGGPPKTDSVSLLREIRDES